MDFTGVLVTWTDKWWTKIAKKKTMNDFLLKKQIRGMNGFPRIWYTKRWSSLKQISEDLMNGFLNLEHSFYINENHLQKTVSSLNIAITWTNFTYEQFPLWNKN
jgi:hypothetical protein